MLHCNQEYEYGIAHTLLTAMQIIGKIYAANKQRDKLSMAKHVVSITVINHGAHARLNVLACSGAWHAQHTLALIRLRKRTMPSAQAADMLASCSCEAGQLVKHACDTSLRIMLSGSSSSSLVGVVGSRYSRPLFSRMWCNTPAKN